MFFSGIFLHCCLVPSLSSFPPSRRILLCRRKGAPPQQFNQFYRAEKFAQVFVWRCWYSATGNSSLLPGERPAASSAIWPRVWVHKGLGLTPLHAAALLLQGYIFLCLKNSWRVRAARTLHKYMKYRTREKCTIYDIGTYALRPYRYWMFHAVA